MDNRPHCTCGSRWLLVAAVAVGMLACARPTLAAEAARIDSINPSCASVGDAVTIIGIGFGAQNVKVTVGGLPAPVLTATGNQVTFTVPTNASLGSTTVTATNPGGHIGSIAFQVCDLRVPASWAGEWEITIARRDTATGKIVAVDAITDVICANEAAGFAWFKGLADCTGTISDTSFAVRCAAEFPGDLCSLDASVQVRSEQTGNTLLGSGEWTAMVSGGCTPVPVSEGVTVDLSGVRLHRVPAGACEQPPPTARSVIQRFVNHPVLMLLAE